MSENNRGQTDKGKKKNPKKDIEIQNIDDISCEILGEKLSKSVDKGLKVKIEVTAGRSFCNFGLYLSPKVVKVVRKLPRTWFTLGIIIFVLES